MKPKNDLCEHKSKPRNCKDTSTLQVATALLVGKRAAKRSAQFIVIIANGERIRFESSCDAEFALAHLRKLHPEQNIELLMP